MDWAGNPLRTLQELGQNVWIEGLQQDLVRSGALARLIEHDGISGITSSPARLERAIVEERLYRSEISRLHSSGADAQRTYAQLAMQDVRDAADELSRVYERSGHLEGFVSLDVCPRLAADATGLVAEARRLWAGLARPNVMIKIPATGAGLVAMPQLIAAGINVNATLLFGVARYREVLETYASGLETRVSSGLPLAPIASVAEVLVSRIDDFVDAKLTSIRDPGETLRVQALLGKAGRDVARYAYQEFKKFIASPRWQVLASYGAAAQRLLWASTDHRNPAYSDVKYVDELIGRQTIAAVSLTTASNYRDHGRPALTLEGNVYEAAVLPADLARFGIDMDRVSEELQAREITARVAACEAALAAISAQCGEESAATGSR